MFNRLSRYLFSQVSITTAGLLVILLSSLWLVHSLKFIDLILKSRESFSTFFTLSMLAIPDLVTILLPIVILIAVISVYVRLRGDNELIVMSACGYSNWRLARPALYVALLGTLLVYFINVFVLHSSFREMRDMEHRLKNALPNVMVKPGVFNSFGNMSIYVQRKRGKHHLEGIMAHVHHPDEAPHTIIAKLGNFFMKDGRPNLVLRDGNRQTKNKDGGLSIVYFEETVVDLSAPQQMKQERPKKPVNCPKELVVGTRKLSDAHARQRLVAEAFQPLLTPWYSVAFVCIALAIFSLEFAGQGTSRVFFISSFVRSYCKGCLLL